MRRFFCYRRYTVCKDTTNWLANATPTFQYSIVHLVNISPSDCHKLNIYFFWGIFLCFAQ